MNPLVIVGIALGMFFLFRGKGNAAPLMNANKILSGPPGPTGTRQTTPVGIPPASQIDHSSPGGTLQTIQGYVTIANGGLGMLDKVLSYTKTDKTDSEYANGQSANAQTTVNGVQADHYLWETDGWGGSYTDSFLADSSYTS